jgi:hypothetical protein
MTTVSLREQLNLDPLDNLSKYLNLLIYGPPNAGKTHFAATAQDHKDFSPALHLGFEQGLLTVAYRKNYDAKEIRTIAQLEAVVELLEEDQKSAKPYYKTVIIDNATELQYLDIDTVMREAKNTSNNPDRIDIDIPSPREWGKIGKRLRRCVQAFRDMPTHTIWTAWRGDYTDDSTNITHYFPKLSGFMKVEFAGYFDIVGYLTSDTKVSGDVSQHIGYLQTRETKRVVAKWRNRPPEVPDVIEDPTVSLIWDYVQKSRIATT